MNMRSVLGFVLLGVGVVLIGYALFASHGIFVELNEPPQVFQTPTPEASPTQSAGRESPEAVVEALVQDQIQNILPAKDITHAFNLFAWSIFAGLLMFAGMQLGSLGIKLLKN